MTPIDRAALYEASQPKAFDAIAAAGHAIQPASLRLAVDQAPLKLDEPSSLALAIIGMATLGAYRGIQKRIAAVAKKTMATHRPLIKPRRRVA